MPTTTNTTTISIAKRFCGPPKSANGGYAAGLLAAFLDGPAEVTLKAPPPLDRPLAVDCTGAGEVELYDGARLLGVARSVAAPDVDFDVPALAEAAAAAKRTFAADRHMLPGCFVCGPHREPGDGLRLQVGPLAPGEDGWHGQLAATWRPAEDLGDADGRVRSEFLWAALDCPTAYACSSPAGMPPILLGRQAVGIAERPPVGEELIVVSRREGRDGRKHFARAALYTGSGAFVAGCRATWIEVEQSVLYGD